jgi:hypothetical protein
MVSDTFAIRIPVIFVKGIVYCTLVYTIDKKPYLGNGTIIGRSNGKSNNFALLIFVPIGGRGNFTGWKIVGFVFLFTRLK